MSASIALPYRRVVACRDRPVAMVVGRTGVGKSSLVNHLLGRAAAEVGDIASTTLETAGFDCGGRLWLLDTRGLAEVGAASATEDALKESLAVEGPQLVIYCLDGSRRDALDEEFAVLERVLARVFTDTWCEPKVYVVVNKVDALEPAGTATLPAAWPSTGTAKGRNIQERIRQVYEVAQRRCRNELLAVTPTVLEWYDGAQPWNLDDLRASLLDNLDHAEIDLLQRFTFDASELRRLLRLQNRLLESDLAIATDADRDRKREWQTFWQQMVLGNLPDDVRRGVGDPFGPGMVDAGGDTQAFTGGAELPPDPVHRTTFVLELLLFQPYLELEPRFRKLKPDATAWDRNLRATLAELGVPESEAEGLNRTFGRHLETATGGTNWTAIALAGGAFAVLAWWAAPMIAGWIGGLMGLKGAVAVKAGLAWLGFGSLAAGGFGMFGGMVVLVGAGAALGAGTSAAAMKAYAANLTRESAVLDCARLMTVFEVAILPKRDPIAIRTFLQRMRRTLFELARLEQPPEILQVFTRGLRWCLQRAVATTGADTLFRRSVKF